MRRGMWASVFLLFCGLSAISAQESTESQAEPPAGEPLEEVLPGFKDKAVVLDINARVLEQNKTVVWNESHKRVTIPGRSVGINLVGANIVVAVQFIPYLRRSAGNILVTQVQIWMEVPNQGVHYQTTMQEIPVIFNEPVYFYPLGSSDKPGDASIEIMLTMRRYLSPDSGDTGTQLQAQQDR